MCRGVFFFGGGPGTDYRASACSAKGTCSKRRPGRVVRTALPCGGRAAQTLLLTTHSPPLSLLYPFFSFFFSSHGGSHVRSTRNFDCHGRARGLGTGPTGRGARRSPGRGQENSSRPDTCSRAMPSARRSCLGDRRSGIVPAREKGQRVRAHRGRFKTVNAYLQKQGTANGHAIDIYTSTNDTSFQFQAAVPVAEPPKDAPTGDIAVGQDHAGKAYKFLHRGRMTDMAYDLRCDHQFPDRRGSTPRTCSSRSTHRSGHHARKAGGRGSL